MIESGVTLPAGDVDSIELFVVEVSSLQNGIRNGFEGVPAGP